MKKTLLTSLLVICSAAVISWAQDQTAFDGQDTTTTVETNAPLERVVRVDVVPPGGPLPQGIKNNFHFEGSTACSQCHVAPQAKSILDDVVDFVSLNEYKIWLNDDPHSKAYLSIIPEKNHFEAVRIRLIELNKAVNPSADAGNSSDRQVFDLPEWGVSNERSQQILKKMFAEDYSRSIGDLFQEITNVQNLAGKRLRKEQLAEFTPRLSATLQQCLSCHAGWDKRQEEFDFEIIKYGTGVSCESCHGPSSKWLPEHSKAAWRTKNPREKEREFGLSDVRNPVSRSDQCYSCHIGNVDQGKVITHEMYAAGHPPLPGIEIESFADQMPRHWRYLSEKKPDFEFASEFIQHFGHNLKTGDSIPWTIEEFPRTKNLLVGGVMASAYSVDLLAKSAGEYTRLRERLAVGEKLVTDKKSPWPEFAAFDCAACHHDLKAGGGGWQRRFAGIPGRPPAPYWPRPLAKLAADYLDLQTPGNWAEKFAVEQEKFQAVLDSQPFGKPKTLDAQGRDYSNWLRNDLANAIQVKPLNREDAISVLQLLCGFDTAIFNPEGETWDFHSARQLAWAINLVYSELGLSNTESETVLGQLRESLMLDLPETGEITIQQQKYMMTWRDFNRKEFIQRLSSLRAAIK